MSAATLGQLLEELSGRARTRDWDLRLLYTSGQLPAGLSASGSDQALDFDPNVVDAYLDLETDFVSISRTYAE